MRKQWFMRLAMVVILGIGWGVMPLPALATEVSVEITGSERRQINIAIPPFMAQGESSQEIEQKLSPVLRRDLQISGYFNTMEDRWMNIEGLHNSDLKKGTIQFPQWSELEARLLIKGNYEVSGNTLKVECRLYDTLGGDFILGKRYESNILHVRDVMHRFADEVMLKMTGEHGMFSTKIIFTSDRSGATELYQIDFDGSNLTRLTDDNSLIVSPAVSPDGRLISYTSYKDNNPDLYIMNLETQEVEQVARFPGLNFSADWSPDGSTLAMILSKDGNPELYLLDVSSKQERRLTENLWNEVSPSWSPDGQELVFTEDRIGAPQLYIIGPDGESVRRLTFRGSYNVSPDWSPTGELIAFASSADGNFNIYTMQPNGDNLRQLTQNSGNNEDPAWSPDGRYIAFQSTRDGSTSIYIMNADGSNQRKLTDNKGRDLSPVWVR